MTLPALLTTIGANAFEGCTNLTKVIFATGSNISSTNFGAFAFPEGTGGGGNTLRDAYQAAGGGAGTYTRAVNGDTWAKN
jgi:hypothetical protein